MTIEIEKETRQALELENESMEELIRTVVNGCMDAEGCPYEAEVSVLLTDNEGIRRINLEQRGIDAPTDVLSFPMAEYPAPSEFDWLEDASEDYFNLETGELVLGDIVISLEKVREQAEAYGHSQRRELAFLTAHSMLHLFGYDHMEEEERRIMEGRQREILDSLGIRR